MPNEIKEASMIRESNDFEIAARILVQKKDSKDMDNKGLFFLITLAR